MNSMNECFICRNMKETIRNSSEYKIMNIKKFLTVDLVFVSYCFAVNIEAITRTESLLLFIDKYSCFIPSILSCHKIKFNYSN